MVRVGCVCLDVCQSSPPPKKRPFNRACLPIVFVSEEIRALQLRSLRFVLKPNLTKGSSICSEWHRRLQQSLQRATQSFAPNLAALPSDVASAAISLETVKYSHVLAAGLSLKV